MVLEVLDRGRMPEGVESLTELAVSLANPELGPELKAAQILAMRQGGRTWLQPDQGGLRSSASLRVRESGPSER